MEHSAEEIKSWAPSYTEALEGKRRRTEWRDGRPVNPKEYDRFTALREFVGNYELKKGRKKDLGLVGLIEGYCSNREHYAKGTSEWKPFGEFASFTETSPGIYRRMIGTTFAEPNGTESLYEVIQRGYAIEAKKRGINVNLDSPEKRADLFFSWIAGTCRGIEVEKYVIEKLNKSSSAKAGWKYERAGSHLETSGVDAIGKNGSREFYISIKVDGAFSYSSVLDYSKRQTKPHAYVNDVLECRRVDNLQKVYTIV